MFSTLVEGKPRAGHQIADGLRDQYLSRTGKRCNASPNVHGDPCKIFAHEFAFPSVYAATHVQTYCTHRLANCASAPDRSGRAIKGSEKAVAGCADLPPAVKL